MATAVPFRFGPTAAASGDNTIFTAADGHTYRLDKFHIVNTSTSASVTVKIGIESSADGSLILPAITVPKKQMIDQLSDAILLQNEALVVNVSAATATITVHVTDLYPHL